MTPFERVRARYRAKSVLGVSDNASQDEIRRAYKDQAFSHHPDHENGSNEELQSINAAYDLLKQDAPTADVVRRSGVKPTRVPSRPMVKPRITVIDEVTLARGRAILADTPTDESTDHLATTIRLEGRKLTYLVPTPLTKGRNRVAVPADILATKTNLATKVITFRTSNSGRGQIRVPDERVRMDFTGANEVVIQFAVDHH